MSIIDDNSPETVSERNLSIDWIAEENNVKDIQSNLSALKSDILIKIKADKTNEYFGTKVTDNDELINKALDEQFKSIDHNAESLFDTFAHLHEDELNTIIKADDITAPALLKDLEIKFETYLFDSSDMKDTFNAMKAMAGDVVKFELTDLRAKVLASTTKKDGTEENNGNANVLLNNLGEGTGENKEKYDGTQDYVSKYPSWKDIPVGKEYDIENIYKDKKIEKVMERIFDDEKDQKEIRKGTFKVNLSKEDGLAGIIIAIREAVKYKDLEDETDPNYTYTKIFKGIKSLSVDETTGEVSLGSDNTQLRKELDKLIKDGLLTYERKGGLDREMNKIAKILTRAQRKYLDAFAALAQSKDDIEMAIFQWNNSLEVTGQSNEDGEEKTPSLINANNVLEFLCDFNGEGTISIEYKRKNNTEQKNQGDVGTLSGPQVMWTIEQAIKLKDVELGKGKGEQLVIQNIIKNMDVSDSRKLTNTEEAFIDNMMTTPEYCTKVNLSILINGYHPTSEQLEKDRKDDTMKLIFTVLHNNYSDAGESFDGMPEMKILFQDAIKKINGGSEEVTPDLEETLVGDEAEKIAEIDDTEAQIKATIDTRLEEVKGLDSEDQKELRELIKTQGVVRVRETIFTAIMKAMDNLTITTNDGAKTNLQAGGLSKSRELRSTKKEILEETTKTLVGGGIHYSATDGLRLTIGIGQNGKSKSGRTTRNRGAETGVVVGTEGINLYIGISGEVAEQYNYGNVINADLSQVKSAKYLGLEAGASASISVTDGTGVEVSGGINRQQDPAEGINQIDKHYRAVSEEIFDINGLDVSKISSKTEFSSYIENKITGYTGGKYKKFVETNKQHLKDNLAFMIKYMEANKFFGDDGKIAQLDDANKEIAMNALLDIIQSGSIETRRSNLIEGLHGHVALTKLSFGVTTSALTFSSDKGSSATLGQDKFGIAGFYIGLRISTWRNMYVPNDQQYLYTQYEMGQGVADYIKNPERDIQKYAEYLQALYNDTRLKCKKDKTTNKIIITFSAETLSKVTLTQFLNLHATTAAEKNFSLKDNVLTIGNVGNIGAYTVTEPQGIRRVLSLGTEKLDDTHRITDDKVNTTIEEITDKVTGSQNLTQNDINTKIIDNMKGPATTPAADLLKIQTETKTFFDTDGSLLTPTGATITYEGCAQGDILTTGVLTITKTANNTYTVKLVASTAPVTATSQEELTIEYIDQTVYEIAVNNIANRNKTEYLLSKTDKLLKFETGTEYAQAQIILNDLSKDLAYLENSTSGNTALYAKFMTHASNIENDDGVINENEITNAIEDLNTLISNTKYTKLQTMLTTTDEGVKAYILDRLKQIFAKEKEYIGKTIGYIVSEHATTTGWESISGPSNEFLKTSYPALFKEIQKQRTTWMTDKTTYNETPDINPNLIGYTAFYRDLGASYKNKKFSLTALGETTTQLSSPISDINKTDAKKWFLGNFEVNEPEVEHLATSLEAKFKEKGVTIKLQETTYEKTRSNIEKLINGEAITLDSSTKISIDINWVFYLLGDCCNESLGMEISKINILKIKPEVVLEGKYSAKATTPKTYDNGMKIYADSHSITGKVIAQEERVSWRHHKGIAEKKPKDKENDDQNVEDEQDDQGGDDENDDQYND
ncbi:MAG: hypothetical protein NT085_00680 [candidate division SR1 bacterium]|nr:hypothetical protein [candidate division SR1 bacterium]